MVVSIRGREGGFRRGLKRGDRLKGQREGFLFLRGKREKVLKGRGVLQGMGGRCGR